VGVRAMAQTPEQLRATKREYYLRNREKIRKDQNEKRRERYRSDPEFRERENERTRKQRRSGYQREYHLRNREKKLASATFNRHGLQPGDWAAMWESQDGLCYLCGDPMIRGGTTGAHVDHDHSCCGERNSCRICRRGLACMDCNLAIGHARNDPARLRRMADALEAAQALVDQRKAEAGELQALF
jgi:hypothetical protein